MTAASTARPPARQLLLLWLGFWLLFAAVAHGNLETTDSGATMHAARNLLLRGDAGMRRFEDQARDREHPMCAAEGMLAAKIDQEAARGVTYYGKKGKDTELRYVWFPVGHVWLMLPCVAVGELLAKALPTVEQRYRETVAPAQLDTPLPQTNYPFGMCVFDHAVVAMVLPSAFGALSVLLLFLLALELGCSRRQALLSAVATLVGTQLFPLGRETLSDGPGMAFLLAALLVAVRVHRGPVRTRHLLLGGFAGGAAVLVRYPHAPLVAVLTAVVGIAALRQKRPAVLSWFLLGALPSAIALLVDNQLRFGSPFDTGYPSAGTWFTYPIWFGLPKLLFAAGKGILWFSPLLWLLLPAGLSAVRVGRLRLLAWILLLIPLLVFSGTVGWQSGQCWGARYVTPGVVAFAALVLPQARPWQSHPRLFRLLLGLGGLLCLTSVVAPTRGHNQLAAQAARAHYHAAFERGEITATDWASVDHDPEDHYFFEPRYSPLHTHWRYAWLSATGGFEDAAGQPRDGAANTIEPLFGVTSPNAEWGKAPQRWEDRNGRHLWFLFWGALLGVSGWLLLLPVAALAIAVLWAGWRAVSKE